MSGPSFHPRRHTFADAEELGFEELPRKGGAIDRNQGPVPPRRGAVEHLRQGSLADPRGTGQKDGKLRRCQALHLPQEVPQGRRGSDEETGGEIQRDELQGLGCRGRGLGGACRSPGGEHPNQDPQKISLARQLPRKVPDHQAGLGSRCGAGYGDLAGRAGLGGVGLGSQDDLFRHPVGSGPLENLPSGVVGQEAPALLYEGRSGFRNPQQTAPGGPQGFPEAAEGEGPVSQNQGLSHLVQET